MEFEVYWMQYLGPKVTPNLNLINYNDDFYNQYQDLCNKSFYEMRVALDCKPYNCCPSRDVISNNKDNIFLLIYNDEIIGTIAIYNNEIDDLMINDKYQNQGYGEQLLKFAICRMQSNQIDNIILRVTKWNQKAIRLYLKNDFKIIKTELINNIKEKDL